MTENPTKPRSFRLTLRGLFLLIAVLGCVMGWVVMVVNNYHQEWRAVDYLIREHNARSGPSGAETPFRGSQPRPYVDITQITPWRIHRPHRFVSLSVEPLDESAWQALFDIKELEALSVSDCDLQTTGDELSRVGRLKSLVLVDTPLAPHDIQAIGSQKALEFLDLGGVANGAERIGPYLKDMQNLESLRLRHATTSASGFRDICQARSLRYVDWCNATVDWSEVHLLANLDNLETLDLRQTNIADDDLAVLAALPNLKTLSLSETNITDQGIANLVNCHALKHLRIDRTQITDESMQHVARLPRLESLNISATGVTNRSLFILATSHSLNRFYVQIEGTAITQDEFDRFTGITP